MAQITIRPYRDTDAAAVGILIAETYDRFNLRFANREQREQMLGPFARAHSTDLAAQVEIATVIRAPMVLVAEEGDEIVGVLRGSPGRLHSLFVTGDRHRRGIGRRLMAAFEDYCRQQGVEKITMATTLYAVPFYQSLGYKKSTGVRRMRSFGGEGFPYQPMKKVL